MTLKNNEKFKMYLKIIIFLIYFISLEIAKIVTARTSTNLSCNNGYQSNSTSLTPLLVGIIVLASTAFIIILMTFYAHRLEMRQKSRTEQKENVRTCLL